MSESVSIGFQAWLSTTDVSRPMADYMTVLRGTGAQIAALEAENEVLKMKVKALEAEIEALQKFKTASELLTADDARESAEDIRSEYETPSGATWGNLSEPKKRALALLAYAKALEEPDANES
ncbi:MAG: hypothetical protein ACRD1K_20590 [Acidimicrobiales bacterium]